MLQDLHGWHLIKVQTDLLEFQYDAQAVRLRVVLHCRASKAYEVDISPLPSGMLLRTEDTIMNELMLKWSKAEMARTELPRNQIGRAHV